MTLHLSCQTHPRLRIICAFPPETGLTLYPSWVIVAVGASNGQKGLTRMCEGRATMTEFDTRQHSCIQMAVNLGLRGMAGLPHHSTCRLQARVDVTRDARLTLASNSTHPSYNNINRNFNPLCHPHLRQVPQHRHPQVRPPPLKGMHGPIRLLY